MRVRMILHHYVDENLTGHQLLILGPNCSPFESSDKTKVCVSTQLNNSGRRTPMIKVLLLKKFLTIQIYKNDTNCQS